MIKYFIKKKKRIFTEELSSLSPNTIGSLGLLLGIICEFPVDL